MNKIVINFTLITFFVSISELPCVTITTTTDQGQSCFLISTIQANYYYQKNAGAFSSILDLNGIDWINYDTTYKKNASGELRGLPSLIYADSIGHPGFAKCTTEQVNDTTIKTRTRDGQWEWSWYFSETRASMKITHVKTGSTYSFAYNGPPANRYKTTSGANYWGNDTLGLMVTNPPHGSGSVTGRWKWGFTGDTTIQRIVYVIHNTYDTVTDAFKWINGSNNNGMASLVFGSSTGSNNLITDSTNTFTIGFLEQKVRDTITLDQCKNAIKDIMQTDTVFPLYGIAVTTHWAGENSAVQGDWGNIVRHDIENDSVTNHVILYKGKSFFPKISPDGRQVAFFILNSNGQGATLALMDIKGAKLKKFPNTTWNTGANAGYLDWPKGKWLFYSDGSGPISEICRIHSETGVLEKIITFKDGSGNGTHPWLWSMDYEGSRMIFRASNFILYFCKVPPTFPEVVTLSPQGGKYSSPDGFYGCQHSMSASGNYVTFGPPTDKHNTIRIKQWWDTTETGCIAFLSSKTLHSWKPSQFDAGGTFYNNAWANNSDEWICAHECIKTTYEVCNLVLYNWKKQRQVVVTGNTGATPDFDAPGDCYVDTSAMTQNPVLRLDKSQMSFTADSGLAATPLSQDIKATNTTGGVLGAVACAVLYRDTLDTQWLSVKNPGTPGNVQILTNTIAKTNLTGGTYNAVVSVSAPNAACAKLYTVQLTINTKKKFSSVKLSPGTVTLAPGVSQKFTAVALDQYNDTIPTLPAAWTWKTDTNATISNGIFKSDSVKDTPYTIAVSTTIDSITLSAKAFVKVERPALTVLFPNGGERFYMGDKITIQWQAGDDNKISSVALDLSLDNGKTWYTLNEKAISPKDTLLWGRFPWVIPFSKEVDGKIIYMKSDSCKLRVRDYQYPAYRDVSDGLFRIFEVLTNTADGMKLFSLKQPAIIQHKPWAFKIMIPASTSYTVQIVTVNGRTIFKKQGQGSFQYLFDRNTLSSGVFIAQLKTDACLLTKKVRIW